MAQNALIPSNFNPNPNPNLKAEMAQKAAKADPATAAKVTAGVQPECMNGAVVVETAVQQAVPETVSVLAAAGQEVAVLKVAALEAVPAAGAGEWLQWMAYFVYM